MERKKHILLALFSFVLELSFGQLNEAIYYAYISGNMDNWKINIDSNETLNSKVNKNCLDLLNGQYGYIAYCIDQGKKDEAETYLNKAEDIIDRLEQKNYNLPLLYAYKSAFVGFRIGLSPYKAPFIGPSSLEYAEKSVSMDPENALGHTQLGNIAYYTPALFGGSKEDAMKHYFHALKLMEKDSDFISRDWNYLNLLVTIINAYFELAQYEKAKKYCLITLKIEPDFSWVKDELYPLVLKKMKNE